MLYRLTPPRMVMWCDFSGSMAAEALERQPTLDLDQLPWEPAEGREFSADLLRLALRHGWATGTGIALDAIRAADLGHADTIMLTRHSAQEAVDELRASESGALMDQLIPGWRKQGEALDQRVAQAAQQAAHEAQRRHAEELAAPPRPELLGHWTRLGGTVPGEA